MESETRAHNKIMFHEKHLLNRTEKKLRSKINKNRHFREFIERNNGNSEAQEGKDNDEFLTKNIRLELREKQVDNRRRNDETHAFGVTHAREGHTDHLVRHLPPHGT